MQSTRADATCHVSPGTLHTSPGHSCTCCRPAGPPLAHLLGNAPHPFNRLLPHPLHTFHLFRSVLLNCCLTSAHQQVARDLLVRLLPAQWHDEMARQRRELPGVCTCPLCMRWISFGLEQLGLELRWCGSSNSKRKKKKVLHLSTAASPAAGWQAPPDLPCCRLCG